MVHIAEFLVSTCFLFFCVTVFFFVTFLFLSIVTDLFSINGFTVGPTVFLLRSFCFVSDKGVS